MENSMVTLGKDDDLLPRLLEELAPPALPAHRFPAQGLPLTLQPIRGRQREQQHGEHHMYPHRPFVFLGGWPSSHCCFAALIQQFSMRLRSSSSSNTRKGFSTGA